MPLGRKPFCRKKNRIRQQKSKIQLAGGKIKKEKNKLEITENYSIGKKIRKRSGTIVESCQLFCWKKKENKKESEVTEDSISGLQVKNKSRNRSHCGLGLEDCRLKTNQETKKKLEITVD